MAKYKVSVVNLWNINNSNIASPNVPNKPNRKMYVTLSMPCDIENLSGIHCYVCIDFTELSTENTPDGSSRHSK